MKIWELLKNVLKEKYYNGNIFFTQGVIPKTKEQKYWYNKALEDSLEEVRNYEQSCESKYNSLIECLSKNGILVMYDEGANTHRIKIQTELWK